jgi:hypothetical protein
MNPPGGACRLRKWAGSGPAGRKPCTVPGGAATNVPRAGEARLVADAELDLALENVESVGVVGVGVRIDALELRLEGHVDRGQLRQVAEDSMRADVALDRLCVVGRGEDASANGRPPSGGGSCWSKTSVLPRM